MIIVMLINYTQIGSYQVGSIYLMILSVFVCLSLCLVDMVVGGDLISSLPSPMADPVSPAS